MAMLIVTGFVRLVVQGHLHHFPVATAGHVAVGAGGGGLLLGASLFIVLRAFANGGSAMTGMEATPTPSPCSATPRCATPAPRSC